MSTNNFTTRTASLRATKIDTSKIILKGKNILEYISDSEFDSYDTRDPQLKNDELDIWNTEISLSEEGHIEVKPHVHGVKYNGIQNNFEGITQSQLNTLITAVKVIDNKVLDANDEHIMYWQTNGLTKGEYMFSNCDNLTTFNADLSSLTEGDSMFYNCDNLTTFNADLSSLTTGWEMFMNCTNLTSFSSDLSSLTEGTNMFMRIVIPSIPTLPGQTPTVTPTLTSFSSNLSSLTNGKSMFDGCKLDAPSVANIVHTLPTHETNGKINIGIGCDNTDADKLLFAQECDCETWQELLDDFSAKNWTVSFQCNGRPTEATTYNMRRGATLPIYTKLEEVIMPTDENKQKPHYAYTSQDGSKFYNINYFHSTNGSTEGYDVFSSLEEAISTYNVTPKN